MTRFLRLSVPLILLPISAVCAPSGEAKWTVLLGPESGFEAFKGPVTGWEVGGSVHLGDNPRQLVVEAGKGVFVNGPKGRAKDLITRENFKNVEIHVEFLIGAKSNSGVKFMGMYEIQILDSFGRKELTGDDCGGIYPRAELKPRYHHIDKGIAPRTNASRPAGQWQTLDAIFQAPRFDKQGKKIASARLVKAVLNGQVIHEDVEWKTPTGNLWSSPEKAAGPILLQGDHGPVAFRNVRVRPYQKD